MLEVKNKAGHSDIYLFEEIGDFGITAKDVAQAMPELKKQKSITMHVNCIGGNFFEGIAIYNLLTGIKEKLTTSIEGIAASAGSFISLAAARVEMCEGSWFMMHEAQGVAVGNSAGFREIADKLDGFSASIADIYAIKTGKTPAEMLAMLKTGETWLNAKSAKDAGFVDFVNSEMKVAACIAPDKFKSAPAEIVASGQKLNSLAIEQARINMKKSRLINY